MLDEWDCSWSGLTMRLAAALLGRFWSRGVLVEKWTSGLADEWMGPRGAGKARARSACTAAPLGLIWRSKRRSSLYANFIAVLFSMVSIQAACCRSGL